MSTIWAFLVRWRGVALDVGGGVAIVAGVYRLETGGPGWWLIVAGVLLIVASFASETV